MLTGVENCIFMVENYVKMVITSDFRCDPIRESSSLVVGLCKNSHFFLIYQIFLVSILCLERYTKFNLQIYLCNVKLCSMLLKFLKASQDLCIALIWKIWAVLCLSQFQLGISSLGNPRENFFERANPATRANFFV